MNLFIILMLTHYDEAKKMENYWHIFLSSRIPSQKSILELVNNEKFPLLNFALINQEQTSKKRTTSRRFSTNKEKRAT